MKHTVRELIEALSAIPSDTIVELEGCDCEGDWNGSIDFTEARRAEPERIVDIPGSPAVPGVPGRVSNITGKMMYAIAPRAAIPDRARKIPAKPAEPAKVLLCRD